MYVRRRNAGTGSVEQRGPDRWRVQVDLGRDPATGKRKRQRFTVVGTKKDAEQALRKVLTQRDQGIDVAPERITVAEYLERWLTDYAEANVVSSTLRRYRQLLRRVSEELGSLRLQELRPAHIQRMYGRIEAGSDQHRPLSKHSVLHHHRVLREALSHAVKWQLLGTNPADAATPPRPPQKEMRTLAPAQLHHLLEVIEDLDLRRLVYVAVQTGARQGELLALRWSDLDLETGQARIQRTLDYHTVSVGPEFRAPKTARGRRNVALSAETVRVLREQRASQAERRLKLGPDWQDHDLVFADPLGRPMVQYRVSGPFTRYVKLAGFAGLRFHDLRHTAATLMLGAGIHPKIVSERLGHATIAITLDTYSHVLPDMQRDAADALDRLLAQPRV